MYHVWTASAISSAQTECRRWDKWMSIHIKATPYSDHYSGISFSKKYEKH